MKPELYWIDRWSRGRLAIAPRPRSGDWLEDEIEAWRGLGVDVVVSLLTADEADELDLGKEGTLCEAKGIEFVSFPIPDRGVPASSRATRTLVNALDKALSQAKTVLVHCRQGIGRSPLVAACLLAVGGLTPQAAFERISASRGRPVPETAEQGEWVTVFARDRLAATARQDSRE